MNIGRALLNAYGCFDRRDGFLLCGGIAYFAVLSLAPALVVALGLASFLLGDEAASGVLERELSEAIGPEPAAFLSELVKRSGSPSEGGIAALVGAAVALYAATRVFVELHNALRRIWGIGVAADAPLRLRAWLFVKGRLTAFVLVLLLGALMAAFVVAEAAVQWFAGKLSEWVDPALFGVSDVVLGYLALTALIAAIYRTLAEGVVGWRDALRGSALTALLLALGGYAVSLYLRMGFAYSVYGAAGSFAALMLASYYCAIIFLFGAALARSYQSGPARRGS